MFVQSKVGLVWHGDREDRTTADLKVSRFANAAEALKVVGIQAIPVVYHDDFVEEVREQILELDAIQVWVNPIVEGRDRSKLDQLLREVANSGVKVFTHPDTILRMGTKQVLVDTKEMSWGTDVVAYRSLEELRINLPLKLLQGARVLKQLRGHSGGGIWKVELVKPDVDFHETTIIRLRHAQRGCSEELVPFHEVLERMSSYFQDSGTMIDQEYQTRLNEGITRVYMVGSQIGGFGHQAINALYPTPDRGDAPQPGPRLYFPPNEEQFQVLGNRMETEWVYDLLDCLKMKMDELPLLWDADFLLGPDDTYVLCEINVSCVSPYPDWANPIFAQAMLGRIQHRS